MALAMHTACLRCAAALAGSDESYICSYECTYCPGCHEALQGVCPNCGGELLRRPRRMPRVQVPAEAQPT